MVDKPWTTLREPDPDATYVAALTRFPLARYRETIGFLRATRAIVKQLHDADGAIGYSLRAHPIKRIYWTLSAWADHDAVTAFLPEGAHGEAMQDPPIAMGGFETTNFPVKGDELPLAFDDHVHRLG